MKRSNVNTKVAALAALGVLLTACSGGSDDAVAEPAETPTGGDAESGLVESERPAPDAPASDSEVGPTVRPTAEEPAADGTFGADANAGSTSEGSADMSSRDAEGGLFGSDQLPSDDARLADNTFRDYGYRDFVETSDDPLSTFALDVDTGSYTVMRRWLDEGQLPPIESVRPEEYVNAFSYDYDTPRHGLEISIDGGPSPFDDDNHLVRIGVQGEIVDDDDRASAALTFVIDTSGSMDRDDRLGLVKDSLSILVDQLDDDDTVAIVTYDDSSGVVLDPTAVRDRDDILDAIDRLRPGGSTNLEAGLREGYRLANEAYRRGGVNRVVLASDGVANVGVTDPDQLAAMIRDDADEGINLVTIGFGMGNFNDVTMEQLADQGDGFYAYVDTEDEAERLFEDELTSTLLTIATDAKIQVEFDEDIVDAYRLIGFENRGVLDQDFRNDDVDAGELGAGHQVTAIYEIELARGIDESDDLGEVFLRWEDPDSGEVVEIDEDIRLSDLDEAWRDTSDDFRLATVVAVFAELLRDNPYASGVDMDDLVAEADDLAERMHDDGIDELADLIETADRLA